MRPHHNPAGQAYLEGLLAERDELKTRYDEIGARIRDLEGAIAAVQRVENPTRQIAESAAALPVLIGQFKGIPTTRALARLMLAADRPLTARELASALYRGGNDANEKQLVQRVRDTFKTWKGLDRVERDPVTQSWKLTAKGRADLAESNEPEQPSEQSLFVQRDSA